MIIKQRQDSSTYLGKLGSKCLEETLQPRRVGAGYKLAIEEEPSAFKLGLSRAGK